MTARSAGAAVRPEVLHGSFSVERDLAASPDRVFSAYADISVRRRWLRMPGDPSRGSHELDFRVGGQEVVTGVFAPAGEAEEALSYRSMFWDVSAGARIVFSYSVTVNGVRRWASLVTVLLSALSPGEGTRLRHTEQYAFLAYDGDGAHDIAHLKGSMPLQLKSRHPGRPSARPSAMRNSMTSSSVGRYRRPPANPDVIANSRIAEALN